jgi:hypothetical protein
LLIKLAVLLAERATLNRLILGVLVLWMSETDQSAAKARVVRAALFVCARAQKKKQEHHA